LTNNSAALCVGHPGVKQQREAIHYSNIRNNLHTKVNGSNVIRVVSLLSVNCWSQKITGCKCQRITYFEFLELLEKKCSRVYLIIS